jgi:XTP/dITP diphosphohydrolase
VTRSNPLLVIATSNPGKAVEIRAALRGVPVRLATLSNIGIRRPFREAGRTFEENARGKSLFYSRATDGLVLAEDSGLEVEALANEPGVRSARFSDPGATDAKNVRKILRLLGDAPWPRRRARFVCLMVLSRRGEIMKTAKGIVRGTIAFEPQGTRGFGYDPVFYYGPFRRTFAELGSRRKNAVSHRGRALRKIRAFLLKETARTRTALEKRGRPAAVRRSGNGWRAHPKLEGARPRSRR